MPEMFSQKKMLKKQPNGALISQMMDQTFPLCRTEIVKTEPAVQKMAERWPHFSRRDRYATIFVLNIV